VGKLATGGVPLAPRTQPPLIIPLPGEFDPTLAPAAVRRLNWQPARTESGMMMMFEADEF
jgi:hypothetical protein